MSAVRPLVIDDLPRLSALLDADPVANCFVGAVVDVAMRSGRLGSEFLGYEHDGALVSVLYLGANVIPVATSDETRAAFADRLLLTGRRGSSIVGPADEVLDLWERVRHRWGPAREVRAAQPLLMIDRDSDVAPDPEVRPVLAEEIDILLPACVDMFTEEVGVSPVAGGAGSAYRARIAEIIRGGRALARIEDGRVAFKAEVGVTTQRACQVQGVWVAPDLRGSGLSVPGMAAVVKIARRTCAPIVSLYVNDFNVAARRCYDAVGFVQVGTFATVLF